MAAGEASFRGILNPGLNSIRDGHLRNDADLKVDKMRHAYSPGTNFGFEIGATPTSKHVVVHTTNAPGVIRGFHAQLNAPGSSTDIDFDLKVDGVSVLSAPITITNAEAAREIVDGIISSENFVAGKVISIEMTVNSSTGAQGAWAWVTFHENTAPN